MLTKKEIAALNLSPTKKDFVQIWNELLEVAGKLSERWDPTSTNESDPGIVILKALTGIADKLNYNIDKNILEAFMPTAAQEESMRKLCDMLGYNIKYYRSAETTVKIKYHNPDPSDKEAAQMAPEHAGGLGGLYIPKFTVITNSDQDISYFITDDPTVPGGYSISAEKPLVIEVPCMEGQLVKCESSNDNSVITLNQLSDHNRFYLPETQIAENGIFVYNVVSYDAESLTNGERWSKVDNLNVQARGTRAFRFSFDSYEGRPYLEFPEDCSELFKEGLFIYYTRTNGVNGNISAGTLTQLELPSGEGWSNVSAESFSVENIFAATSGANAETIDQAYNNFKKTIGTFETLVTCRDYMNKIYSFIDNGKPLVSNVLVTDIRNDINRAVTICSCDDAGILYKETPVFVKKETTKTETSKTTTGVLKSQGIDPGESTFTGTTPGTPVYQRTDSGTPIYQRTVSGTFELIDTVPGESILQNTNPGEFKFDTKTEGKSIYQDTIEGKELTLYETNKDSPELLDETISDTISYTSNANKPYFSSNPATKTIDGVQKTTYWRMFNENGFPLFPSEFIPAGGASSNSFDTSKDGEVYEDTASGKKVWHIKQQIGSSTYYFRTNLPIEEIAVPVRIYKVTEKYKRVDTANYLKTDTEKYVKTDTANFLRVDKEKYEKTDKEEYLQTDMAHYLQTNIDNYVRADKETFVRVDTEHKTIQELVTEEPTISHFDLVLYPFKSYNQIKSNVRDIRAVYDASFSYSDEVVSTIRQKLDAEGLNTVSHTIKKPNENDILSINNYLRLSATIATNSKVTTDEGATIVDNIKKALANAFNLRELDFGDEIPFESIVDVIEKADTRIHVASLNEPALYTTFSVLKYNEDEKPEIVEYAVASDWLTADMAETTGRFDMTNIIKDANGSITSFASKSFNSKEAKEIYNKLAVRNVLAGRVPLFNYNDSFEASFFEGAYQVTNILDSSDRKPADLATPTADDPYTIWAEDDTIYTGQFNDGDVIYTKTSTVYEDNIITENIDGDGKVDSYITDIKTDFKVIADDSGIVSDVTLADGEFIKFRAPNFITSKTYPAYVNYYLELANGAAESEAVAAEAVSLYEILNSDYDSWEKDQNINWGKALSYFEWLDTNNPAADGKPYKKTFTLSQTISAYNPVDDKSGNKVDGLKIFVDRNESTERTSASEFLALSGCVKLLNLTAETAWAPTEGEPAPTDERLPELPPLEFGNQFITNIADINSISGAIDAYISLNRESFPTRCSWTVSFNFECVPFEPRSLPMWEELVRSCIQNYDDPDFTYQILKPSIDTFTPFKPVEENNTVLWRLFGEGYDAGKYVTIDSEKLLKFDKSYFGLLPDYRLKGVYLAKTLGADATPVIIKNDEEYMLQRGERLYIEYTPSTTTEDGTTTQTAAVTVVHGEGTIIRPSGFEGGLVDSSMSSTTAHKDVTFIVDNTPVLKQMQRFGANEQVEIREFAEVTLSQDTFSTIYVYKNFNGCPELEELNKDADGNRVDNVYTLKDGEAIFYTDANKSEFAYYTSGTKVTLEGDITIGECDIIELATIFDSGIQAIPWTSKNLRNAADKIIFQEFQYVTLGPGDTIKSLKIIDAESTKNEELIKNYLGSTWKYCSDVEYLTANNKETSTTLPAIKFHNSRHGDGWEACGLLELNASSSTAQVLRSTDKVEASLILSRTKTTGGADLDLEISPVIGDLAKNKNSLYFKTNLACQSQSNEINIGGVWYNPDKKKGFQIRVFSNDAPVIVRTKPEKVVPYDYIPDLAEWTGEPLVQTSAIENWNQVSLEEIKAADKTPGISHDSALRLAVNLLPNTYGVFCIYVDYRGAGDSTDVKTWLEVIPGTKAEDVTLLNVANQEADYIDADNKLLSKLYLNPGINCIRVNKTGRFFIKTSQSAQGLLFFDELRLVNCLPIKYTDSSNYSVTLKTQGLNLAQLGYLDTSETDDDTTIISSLDSTTKEKLQKAYVDDLYTNINEAVQNTDNAFAVGYNEITKLLPMVQTIVDTEAVISAELSALRGMNSQRFKALTEKYNEVSDKLKKEVDLLDALNKNEKADKLEQELIKLLDSFDSIKVTQQQIFDELAVLKDKAEYAIVNVSNDEVLEDFTNSSDRDSALSEIQTIVANRIEEYYQNRLTVVSNNLNNSVNSPSKSTLLSIFEKLKATATAPKRAELRTKVNELRSLVENSIDSVIEDIVEAAEREEGPDYAQLIRYLTQLRNIVDSNDINVLVAELEQAVNDSNDEHLKKLLEPFWKDDSFDSGAALNSDIITEKIDPAISAAQARDANRTKAAVNALKSKFSEEYEKKLETLLTDMDTALTYIFRETVSLDDILADITANEYSEDKEASVNNSQIKLSINQLKSIISERNSFITSLNSLSSQTLPDWKTSKCKDFIREAITAVWPTFMAIRLDELLSNLTQIVEDALEDGLADYESNKEEANNIIDNETSVMKTVLNSDAFELLFDKIKVFISANAQATSNAELIGEINNLLEDSDELTKALNSNTENEAISSLIAEFKAASGVKQKQKVQTELKEALTSAVDTTKQLFSVVAGILCPNLTKYLADFDKSDLDVFYEKLLQKLKDFESSIRAGNIDTINIPDDTDCFTLLKLKLGDFKASLVDFDYELADTLMPKEFHDALGELSDILETSTKQSESISILNSRPLEAMSSTELREIVVDDATINSYLEILRTKIAELEGLTLVDSGYEDAFRTLRLEDQLLAEIRALDKERAFYYNVPVAPSIAIDFNESIGSRNTLMNPQMNYDVNNINNHFVISKLDIDFLDSGIQIARSSKSS